jgi:ankyrin repeat protein
MVDRLESIGVNEMLAAEFERLGIVTKEQMMAVTPEQIEAAVKNMLNDLTPDLVDPMRHMYDNQLLHSSQYGDLGAVRDALAHNADVNFTDNGRHGNTALMFAAARGHYKIAAALLEAGASVSLTAHGNFTCLHRVCFSGVQDQLCWAREQIIVLFIDAGANLSTKNSTGEYITSTS